MGAKDGTPIPARGELMLNIDGVDRVFVYEVPDILMLEETVGMGVSAFFSPQQAGVKPICNALCCGILYSEPTITPARVARWLGKPVTYRGPNVVVGGGTKKQEIKTGTAVGLGSLYLLVRHFVNLALPDNDEPKTEEEVKDALPPVRAPD